MRPQHFIFIFIFSVLALLACSSSKKATAPGNSSTTKVTKTDVFRGGTSFENAVIIKVQKEADGVGEEYKWLAQNYPGYTTIRKMPTTRGSKHYDIVRIKTKDGQEKDIYFDTTSFFGKW
jgi:ABC-type glycerol-3-phosphate transport system substrate-binding protein